MTELNRAFKGIWIPKEIWLNEDLTVMEKLFLVEIDSLDNEKGCYASNKYFADFFGISKGRCSQIINSLNEKQLISIEYFYEGKEVKKRTIKVVNKLNRVVNKLNNPIKNIKQGYLENAKENNTSLNNTSNNNTKDKDTLSGNPTAIPYKEITDYLNAAANKNYRHTTVTTRKAIKARCGEGFDINDFKKVIDIKTKEWKDDVKMNQFLRPETLFGTKFESYLNQTEQVNSEYYELNKEVLEESRAKREADAEIGNLPF